MANLKSKVGSWHCLPRPACLSAEQRLHQDTSAFFNSGRTQWATEQWGHRHA